MALASDRSLMLSSYLGSSVHRSLWPTVPRFNRSPGIPNLRTAMECTEPAHGARVAFQCIPAGQDPSARRCAYLDQPAVASGEFAAHCVPRHAHGGSYDHQPTTHTPATPTPRPHAGPGAARVAGPLHRPPPSPPPGRRARRSVPGAALPDPAANVLAVLELLRAMLQPTPRHQIKSPTDAAGLLMLDMSALDQEHFRTVLLDTRKRVKGLLERGDPKTDSSQRVLPMPAPLARVLEHLRRLDAERDALGEAWQEHGFLFPSARGTPLEPRNLVRHFKSALAKAGLSKTTRFPCKDCCRLSMHCNAQSAPITPHSGSDDWIFQVAIYPHPAPHSPCTLNAIWYLQ